VFLEGANNPSPAALPAPANAIPDRFQVLEGQPKKEGSVVNSELVGVVMRVVKRVAP
jgi:hypothetical protein